jgi:hypothetical protein
MAAQKIKMVAVNTVQRQGMLVLPGKVFETAPKEAARLVEKKAAKYYQPPAQAAEEEPEKPEEQKKGK